MTILIPTPLRAYTGQKSTVEVDAPNVKEALAKLTETHPDLKQHLFGAEGKLRSFVNVYVNDDDIRDLPEKDLTPIKSSDEISIIPSIAGGNFPGIAEAALAEPQTKELPKLTNEEIARLLKISVSTVKNYWNFSRAWLFREIEDGNFQDDAPV